MVASAYQLWRLRESIPVAVASDNTRDQFYAYGDLDLLDVFGQVRALSMNVTIYGKGVIRWVANLPWQWDTAATPTHKLD